MGGKHLLIMALCCLIPLAAIFLVSVLAVPIGTLGTVAIFLLCPLLHIFMMRGMHGHGSQAGEACHEEKAGESEAAVGHKETHPSLVSNK